MAERVNIPVLPCGATRGRSSGTAAHRRNGALKRKGAEGRSEVRALSRSAIVRLPPRGRAIEPVIRLPRKSAKHIRTAPVPQTDTGRRVEHTEALGDSWLRN